MADATETDRKFFKWTIEIEVSDNWVEDGFDFDKDQAQNLAESLIPWAYANSEVRVRVVKSPPREKVLKQQGYTHDPETGRKLPASENPNG